MMRSAAWGLALGWAACHGNETTVPPPPPSTTTPPYTALSPASCGDRTCGEHELCGTCAEDCGGCTSGEPVLQRGPYLQSGSPHDVVVRWRTEDPTPSVVAIGVQPGIATRVARSDTPTTEHAVRVAGLQADTRYYYAVGAPDRELVGLGDPSFTVRTSPPTGTARPIRIWVIGDSGTANQRAEDVRDAYLSYTGARGTDLWLMLGDNAYDSGTDSEYQRAVFERYPSVLRSVVLWPTLGNHDGASADSNDQSGPYFDIFTLPAAAEAGGTPSGTEAYYAFDYGNIHFVCLDSYGSDTDPDGDMMRWLDNDLMATAQPWIVAFWHHPPYSKGSHDSDSDDALAAMRRSALPILESHGVDLVLSGHSHSYERSMYLHGHYGASSTLQAAMVVDDGDGRIDSDGGYLRAGASTVGAVYVVAGSSGMTQEAPLDHPAMYISLLELGSVVIDVDGGEMDVGFIDDAGSRRDWFSIVKP